MAKPKRSATTVYLDRRVAEAARSKAARTGRSLSELVNEGLARLLSRGEKGSPYEEFLKELRREGLL